MPDEPSASPPPAPGSPGPTPPPRKKRWEFLEPPKHVPLHKAPEFQQMFGLVMLLLLLVVFALMYGQTTWRALERVFPKNPEKPPEASQGAAPADPNAEAEARRLVQEERRRRILTLFEGSLADAVDGSDFHETAGYRLMMRHLSQYSPEAVTQRVTGPLDWEKALHDPDAMRGEFVSVRGQCIELSAVKLDEPIGEITDIYRGYVGEPDATQVVAFDMPYRPEDFKVGWNQEPVVVEGIFYRTVSFEPRRGKKKVEIPYLLVRNIRVDPQVPSGTSGMLAGRGLQVVVGLSLVTLVAALVIYRVSRGQRRRGEPPPPVGFQQMFEKKFREEARRNKPPAPPA
jgi:hypothetical protein